MREKSGRISGKKNEKKAWHKSRGLKALEKEKRQRAERVKSLTFSRLDRITTYVLIVPPDAKWIEWISMGLNFPFFNHFFFFFHLKLSPSNGCKNEFLLVNFHSVSLVFLSNLISIISRCFHITMGFFSQARIDQFPINRCS